MFFYSISFLLELTQNISDMFFRGEIEEELQECPCQLEMVRFRSDSDMQMSMMSVEYVTLISGRIDAPEVRCGLTDTQTDKPNYSI